MPSIEELRETRIDKIKKLKEAGILAYPAKTNRTHSVAEALVNFGKLFKSRKTYILAGRFLAQRGHGGVPFLDVFDIGDFVEIKGTLFTTKRGEKTIEASDYKMLSKAILPLPDKWCGINDVEDCLRKRYLDIIFNPEIKEMIEKRAIFWNSVREFLIE